MADHSNPRSAKRKEGDFAELISNSVALRANQGRKKKFKGATEVYRWPTATLRPRSQGLHSNPRTWVKEEGNNAQINH